MMLTHRNALTKYQKQYAVSNKFWSQNLQSFPLAASAQLT